MKVNIGVNFHSASKQVGDQKIMDIISQNKQALLNAFTSFYGEKYRDKINLKLGSIFEFIVSKDERKNEQEIFRFLCSYPHLHKKFQPFYLEIVKSIVHDVLDVKHDGCNLNIPLEGNNVSSIICLKEDTLHDPALIHELNHHLGCHIVENTSTCYKCLRV